jgi:hypothetical protein
MRNDDILPFSRLRRRKYQEKWPQTNRKQGNSGIQHKNFVIINALKSFLKSVFKISIQLPGISFLGQKHSSAFKQNGKESLAFKKVILTHIPFLITVLCFCFFTNTVFQAQF